MILYSRAYLHRAARPDGKRKDVPDVNQTAISASNVANGLEFADGLAEGVSLLGILKGIIEGRLRVAQGVGGHPRVRFPAC
jgi:hypothetical protein